MMAFYESIADYYDDIFPLDQKAVDFVIATIGKEGQDRQILDVGCGTGDLALALSRYRYAVTAIDSDRAMIEKAKEKGRDCDFVSFHQTDMRALPAAFGAEFFDGVLCLGNTLVHLAGPEEIGSFLADTARILKKGGRLIVQILNYDHVLDHSVQTLPLIDNQVIRFDRSYTFGHDRASLLFATRLTVKKTGETVENAIPLYPLRRGELDRLLDKAGFVGRTYYGDFGGSPLREESLPLIVEASMAPV